MSGWLDPDLQARMDKLDCGYRDESLRLAQARIAWSPKLSEIIDEQGWILMEQFQRDDQRKFRGFLFWVVAIFVFAMVCLGVFR